MYQPEFEECWALGLVSQHDPISHIMEITLDKVNKTITVKYKADGLIIKIMQLFCQALPSSHAI